MDKSGHAAMGVCFHSFIYQVFIESLLHMVPQGHKDESAVDSALRCVASHSLNCECEGKGKGLLVGLMSPRLWSGLVVLGVLFRCVITSYFDQRISELFF